jgi:hypothetical protein
MSFPSEPDFVQNSLSVWSHFIGLMKDSLLANPTPQRLVLFVLLWHHTMAILSLKLDKLFILLVPALVVWWEAVGVSFPSEPDFVQKTLSIKSNCVLLMILSLLANPKP